MTFSRALLKLCVCVGLAIAVATSNAQTRPTDTRVGCISRSPAGLQFIDGAHRSREQIMAGIQAASYAGANLSDPCLLGQTANVPAMAYARLASRYPTTYLPLPSLAAAVGAEAVPLPTTTVTPAASFPLRFTFTDLDTLLPPDFFPLFSPTFPTVDGRVFGTAYDSNFNGNIAVYQRGTIKIFVAGYANAVSHLGIVGGFVITDPETFYTQAAVYRGNSVQLIPRVQGEVSSTVVAINDFGMFVVQSSDVNGNSTFYLFRNGKRSVINIGLSNTQVAVTGMNDSGVIVGWIATPNSRLLAFRYVSATGKTTALPPLPTEPYSFAMGINELGDIVGYSFGNGTLERVGIWQANNAFITYFVEGTPAFPTVSNSLLINDLRHIVITQTNDQQSYLVPQKGVRLTLANIIAYDPSVQGAPAYIWGINDFDVLTGSTPLGIDFMLTPKLP